MEVILLHLSFGTSTSSFLLTAFIIGELLWLHWQIKYEKINNKKISVGVNWRGKSEENL